MSNGYNLTSISGHDMHYGKTEALISLHEGSQSHLYLDTKQIPTIGIGRNISASGPGLRQCEISQMIQNDIEDAHSKLVRSVPFFLSLSDVRQAVLIDMTHNLGIAGILKFAKTLAAIARQDYGTAAREMLDSKWANDVGKRARRLSAMMATDRWPVEIGR